MPTSIDEERFRSQETLDMSKPQGTAQGLPVKQIPHQEYPKCAYRHPVTPYREVQHRNVNHEVVHRELVATEHQVHVCLTAQEFREKLSKGWVAEPYIQQAPPDPTEHLYTKVTDEVAKRMGMGQALDPSKASAGAPLDLATAQRFLQSRGYDCPKPKNAADFVKNLNADEQAGFLKELADFVASEGEGGK